MLFLIDGKLEKLEKLIMNISAPARFYRAGVGCKPSLLPLGTQWYSGGKKQKHDKDTL